MQVDFVNSPDATTLRAILRALPADVEIISVYARGGEHFAWIRLPARAASEFPTATVSRDKTNKKGK